MILALLEVGSTFALLVAVLWIGNSYVVSAPSAVTKHHWVLLSVAATVNFWSHKALAQNSGHTSFVANATAVERVMLISAVAVSVLLACYALGRSQNSSLRVHASEYKSDPRARSTLLASQGFLIVVGLLYVWVLVFR